MKIREEHLFHGAALNQIAEHKRFTAINALKVKGKVSRSAFLVNDSVAVFLKYASSPAGKFKEYRFTYNEGHKAELKAIARKGLELHIAQICVEDREICCLKYEEFLELRQKRRVAAGHEEDQLIVIATLEPNEAFRVYVNSPGTKGHFMPPKKKIARNRFPNAVVK